MKKLVIATLLAAAWLFAITLCGNSAFAQMIPPPLMWVGYWYGNPDNPSDWYKFNDAVISTGAHRLHDIGITGKGLTTAVIDAGFNIGHDIYGPGSYRIIYQDFENEEPNGSFHGAHVAGIVLSMAPDSHLWLANIPEPEEDEDSGLYLYNDKDVAKLLRKIALTAPNYNIFALNNSWGDPLEGLWDDSDDLSENYPISAAAAQKLRDAGVVALVSSGNQTVNFNLMFPNGLPGFLSIGALAPTGEITNFSNLHENIFLLAPGMGINSAYGPGDTKYQNESGTSMASPHVSGAVTLLKSGARNATATDIIDAVFDSADRIIYDGYEIISDLDLQKTFLERIKLALENNNGNTVTLAWLESAAKQIEDDKFTRDDNRTLSHIFELVMTLDNDENLDDLMKMTGGFGPLGLREYGFLRVDKAYMLLTMRRTENLAQTVSSKDAGLAGIFRAYANELGSGLDYDTSQVFQRLDYWNGNAGVLTAAARQMSPRFTNATAESAHLGLIGLHRFLGSRAEFNRFRLKGNLYGEETDVSYGDPGDSVKTGLWMTGFGSFFNKSGTLINAGYDGHFAGTALGFGRQDNDWTFDLFAAWANHRVSGDGLAKGDWFTFGAYGSIERQNKFIEGSLSYGYADYGLARNVFIPGARFSNVGNLPDIVLDPMYKSATASTHAHNFSVRAASGLNLWEGGNWIAGPRGEMSLSHLTFSGYQECGADSLSLSVNGYRTNYLEGGLGLFMGKQFQWGEGNLTATGKVMGMYGNMTGNNLSGRFLTFGSQYQVNAGHISTAWVAPEATLAWNNSQNLSLSAGYSGRFGEKYRENAVSFGVKLTW